MEVDAPNQNLAFMLQKDEADRSSEEQTVMERLCNAYRISVATCGASWHSGLIAKFSSRCWRVRLSRWSAHR
jgi:hypothetical protein